MSPVGLIWHGDEIAGLVRRQVKINLMRAAMDLQSESVKEAPKDTGDLRGNCTIDESQLDELQVDVEYSLPYARRQHEELNYRHTNGKAKFLEDPYNRKKLVYQKYIGEVKL